MKKLIMLLLLFCGLSIAQTQGVAVGQGYVWTDSLTTYHDSTGGDFYQVTDSVWILPLRYNYSFPSITVTDTGATYTDTLKLYKGVEIFNNAGVLVDTSWCDLPLPVKLNDWVTADTVLAGAGETKTYLIMENNINLLKIVYANTGAAFISGIKTLVSVEAKLEK